MNNWARNTRCRSLAAQVGHQLFETLVAAIVGRGAIDAVGAGATNAISVVADLHQAAELADAARFEHVDAHPAAENFRNAEQEHAARMIAGRLRVGRKIGFQQVLVLLGEHRSEIVAGHHFGHAQQPAVNVAGGEAQLGRIDVAEVLDRARDFRTPLFSSASPKL